MTRERLSVLIPCYNNEDIIDNCLQRVRWADEVVVCDSFSTDRTIEIARRYADRVLQHEYRNSASQKNWAIPQVNHPWVLIVDTDERVTPELRAEIEQVLANGTDKVGFRIPRANYLFGRWLRHGDNWPDYQIRLFRRDRGRYQDREVHAHVLLEGECGTLEHPFLHYPHRSLANLRRVILQRYTTWEAMEKNSRGVRFRWHQLLVRPAGAFIYRYILKQGFRDGWQGLLMAGVWTCYVFITYLKLRRLQVQDNPLHAVAASAKKLEGVIEPIPRLWSHGGPAVREMIRRVTPSRYRYHLQSRYYLLRSILYTGNNVCCPCCSGTFRYFLPFGVQPRPGAQCPRCGALERHRMLTLYLRERTGFFVDRLSVLDIAPELSLYRTFSKQRNLDYVTADLHSPLAQVKLDITEMPLPSDTFDVILCMHVLEHIVDDRKAMREIFRVLKPGGWGIIQVPVDPESAHTFQDPAIVSPRDREAAFGQSDHVRVYGGDYVERLVDAGFSVDVVPYLKELSAEDIQRYGLTADCDENIYVCRK